MQQFVPSRFVVPAVALAVLLPLVADEIAFAPKPNTEVSKKLTLEVDAELAELSLQVNGESIPAEALGDFGDRSIALRLLANVTEKFVATEGGKPTELVRTYDELTGSAEAGGEKDDIDAFAELAGKTVSFKWNESESEYEKAFVGADASSAELDDLWDDMEVRVLLPTRKVSEGDTWEVEGEKLGPLFFPGGFISKSDGGDGDEFAQFREEIEAEFEQFLKEFKVQCKYKGTRDSGGTSVREVELVFDGSAKLDLSELFATAIAMQGEEMPEMDIDASVTLKLTGTGVVFWDHAAGHLNSFEMRSDIEVDLDAQMRMEQDGQAFDMSFTGRAEGKAAWDMEAAAAK